MEYQKRIHANTYLSARRMPGLLALVLTLLLSATTFPAKADDFVLREQAAQKLVVSFLKISRVEDILQDFDKLIHNAYVPFFQRLANEKWSDPALKEVWEASAEMAQASVPALDEFAVFLKNNREELISDAIHLIAKHATLKEIFTAQRALDLKATPKIVDISHKYLKIGTNYTENDLYILSDLLLFVDHRFSKQGFAWVKKYEHLDRTIKKCVEGKLPPPPPSKLAKARQIVADSARISRFGEIADEQEAFLLDNVFPLIPVFSPREGRYFYKHKKLEMIKFGIFVFDVGRHYAFGFAPGIMAKFFDDEELDIIHKFVNSNYFRAYTTNWYNLSKAVIALNKDDLIEINAFVKELKYGNKIRKNFSSADRKELDKDLSLFFQKWSKKAKKELSPKVLENFMSVSASSSLKFNLSLMRIIANKRYHRPK
jgi:hypothetical protein